MKKNFLFISITLILILLLGIGVSYSMWNITVSQDSISTISTDCFDLTISNKDSNISLENAYPISNSKGMRLTPYTFTVTNTCDITAEYSINLEILKNSTLSSNFIDVMLDGNINLLSSYDKTEKINNSSIESRKIDTGILKSNESKDYSLRLWIDNDTTLEDLNNEVKIFKAKVNIVGKPINYTGDTVFNFDYTGGEQTFTAPVSGIYRLETWGAQGGNNAETEVGGFGGYSDGIISLKKDNLIFINIGGQGKLQTGGYNGGGSSSYNSGSGGGATHISNISGVLATLENSKNSILIVSGGGGGAVTYYEYEIYQAKDSGSGGSGGGIIGNNGTFGTWTTKSGFGGSQISGGSFGLSHENKQCGNNGTFGQGGNFYNQSIEHCNQAFQTGGGGGYYGGGSARHSGGGGGSGYIGNLLLKDKIMYCYNCEESSEENTKTISTTCSEETPTSYCAKLGNGYARITLISIDE